MMWREYRTFSKSRGVMIGHFPSHTRKDRTFSKSCGVNIGHSLSRLA